VVTSYLEHGGGGLTDDVLNAGIQEDRDVRPTLIGLLEVGGVLASMLGTALGSNAAAILGSLADGDGP
jgi:outer membrane lipoprotein SlyB